MRSIRLPFGLSMYPVPSTEPSSDPVQFPVRSGFAVAAGVVYPERYNRDRQRYKAGEWCREPLSERVLLDSGEV